ncbi:hypothetical protein [Kaistella jeonii]|uniref:Lipoprotein n=1 Tax=Kaistella jeonii TaxID=266749 RepID=A0A0C1FR64_9FLAO|nr:hypothetical protein [Kaistella jeonii]KIA90394.1 hypothetical protein OA86_00355 [Kaistella jeonii]SFB73512.1 hypothetical protein SAMN05421876_101467 [Kaistella jeonii]VEI95053.1 Uncharacterised protein [Kaistella jeonii]
MKKYLLTTCAFIFILSCEKKISENINIKNTNDSVVVVPENSEPIESSTQQTCYLGVTGKDSVFISLDDNLGTITGKMRYKNAEKDSSFGDIVGTQNGDTLKLNYTFQSEGTMSEREIYFLKKKDQLTEGIGDHKIEGKKDFYENTSKLKFDGSSLKQVDCKDFDKKVTVK